MWTFWVGKAAATICQNEENNMELKNLPKTYPDGRGKEALYKRENLYDKVRQYWRINIKRARLTDFRFFTPCDGFVKGFELCGPLRKGRICYFCGQQDNNITT